MHPIKFSEASSSSTGMLNRFVLTYETDLHIKRTCTRVNDGNFFITGLYQGAGILSNFLTSSTMESESTGPRAGAQEVIKGLWQSVAKILNSVRSAKSVGQAVMDTAV